MLVRLRHLLSRRRRPLGDARALQLAAAFLVSGLVFSLVELCSIDKLTAPALGLLVIGVAMAPVGAIALLVSQRRAGDGPATDDGFGGGGDDDGGDPLPPTGGLEIDWDLFEQEFRAYAESVSEDVLLPA